MTFVLEWRFEQREIPLDSLQAKDMTIESECGQPLLGKVLE
jgi:hypothetical protein